MNFAESENDMLYTEYTNLPTEELAALAFEAENVDPLALELAHRVEQLLTELEDLAAECAPEVMSLDELIDQYENQN